MTRAGGARGAVPPTLVIATRNRHKVSEIRAILFDLGVVLLSSSDLPGVPEVEEDGATLEENAAKKAESAAAATGLPAFADDTGLSVEALDGAPGVLSARYAGAWATDDDNNRKLLRELEGVPPSDRGATFRAVVALSVPGRATRTVEGRTHGVVLEVARGCGGFGYDPLFVPDGQEKTYAEMSPSEKNAVSHRGKAMRAGRALIAELVLSGTLSRPR